MKRTILAVVTCSKSEAPPPGGASASKGSTLVINGAEKEMQALQEIAL